MKARMKREVRTKGTTFEEGEIVQVTDYPEIMGRDYWVEYCTVIKEGYGLVSVHKSDVEVMD